MLIISTGIASPNINDKELPVIALTDNEDIQTRNKIVGWLSKELNLNKDQESKLEEILSNAEKDSENFDMNLTGMDVKKQMFAHVEKNFTPLLNANQKKDFVRLWNEFYADGTRF